MNRQYLFLSGEFRVTMPVVFERENWLHTMSPSQLIIDDKGCLRRQHVPLENLKGVIFYADMDNKQLEKENIEFIINNDISCWPNPKSLLKMINRHDVAKECQIWGLPESRYFSTREQFSVQLSYPFVIKTGNAHRGQGKHLILKEEDIPNWDDIATIEPFWKGISIRVLVVGDYAWALRIDNDSSWIKNSAGAETSEMKDIPKAIIAHSLTLMKAFGLDIAGCDYIIDKLGNWHFLEINQFPGVDILDEATPLIKDFLRAKMNLVESLSDKRATA